MRCDETHRTAIHRPPKSLSAKELNEICGTFLRPTLLDVRIEAQFLAGHLEGSVNAPEGNTSALLGKLARANKACLICNDGHLSKTVARMMGVCGYGEVSYLEGGLKAWKEAGGTLMETTRRGEERRLHEGGNPDGPGLLGRLWARLSPPVFYAGLAGAAALVGGMALLVCR